MLFRLLGPLSVEERGRVVELARGKERALLALLLLRANEPVPSDRLVDELWPERVPEAPLRTLQVYVSRLRKALGADRLLTTRIGYSLRVEPGELDTAEFERLANAAHEALLAGDPRRSERFLAEALTLWRGPPLADFQFESWAQTEIRRLEELHSAARADLAEAHLAEGQAERAARELEQLIAENPLWERPRAQLMRALYRSGRQAEALAVYRETRALLREELGLEPSPELQTLERSILQQDASLLDRVVTDRRREARRRGAVSLALGGAFVLAAAIAAFIVVRGRATAVSVSPDSVAVIDPSSNRIATATAVDARPVAVATGGGAVWAAGGNDSVWRIDPKTKQLRQTVRVGGGPTDVVVTRDAVWVTNGLDGTVSRIDPRSSEVVQTIFVGNGPTAVTAGERAVWVANSADGTISQIDSETGRLQRRFAGAVGASALAAGFHRLWLVSAATATVTALDPRSGQILSRIAVGRGPDAVATGAGAVWVTNRDDGTVSRIDPEAMAVEDTVRVGRGPNGVTATNDAVWVTSAGDSALERIDPTDDEVVATVHLGNPPAGVAAGRVLYVPVSSTGREHRGGTLRVVGAFGVHSVDPGFGDVANWPVVTMTNDGLVGFRRIGGVQGTEIVPDLATGLPTVSDSGKSYTLQLRSGIRYSDGRRVQPADFRRAIQRVLAGRSTGAIYYKNIVGAGRCTNVCNLSRGIVIDRETRTITFHLLRPDPDFLFKLALPYAFAIPPGTPWHDTGTRSILATGPYRVGSFDNRRQRLRLVRNPRFRVWSPEAQPDGYPDVITMTITRGVSAGVRAVTTGSADIAVSLTPELSKGELSRLATRYPAQLHKSAQAETSYFFLNTHTSPFDRTDVRRAVNEAFDRRAFARLIGPSVAPACRILAPTLPGYRPTCPYLSGGIRAVDAARRRVRKSGTSGAEVTVWAPDVALGQARFMASVLEEIGYHARLKVIALKGDPNRYFGRVADSRVGAQTGYWGWGAEFPSPIDMIQPMFSCAAFVPGAPARTFNPAEFCVPSLDHEMERAVSLEAQDAPAATILWQRIEREILSLAPVVPTSHRRRIDFTSARTGNYQYHPEWGALLDQLWVR